MVTRKGFFVLSWDKRSMVVCLFAANCALFGFDCVPGGRPHGVPSGMPAAALKPVLDGMVAEGGGEAQCSTSQLSLPSLKVPRELLRSFPHSKRVGSYLVGKMINRGSFAKVMEGLHISTGEKVSSDARRKRERLYRCKIMNTGLENALDY